MRVLITMEVGLQIEGPRIMPLEQETDIDMSDFNFLLAWIDVAVPSGLIICASILSMHKIFFHIVSPNSQHV